MYVCRNCGYRSLKWLGRCPVCGEWDSFVQEESTEGKRRKIRTLEPVSLHSPGIERGVERRYRSGIEEWDRVLGGGIVEGSLILLGGDPGIGKSTLALQISDALQVDVLYISAEESPGQVIQRAKRLGLEGSRISIVSEYSVDAMVEHLKGEYYNLVVVDSIQMVKVDENPSYPGSVSQVRDSLLMIQEVARKRNIAFLIIGHVTKSGEIAGPRTMEHMVDVVLYLEGDRKTDMRILRAYKNRFGTTDEIGLFLMKEKGMVPVEDPYRLFISQENRPRTGVARSILLEGRRSIPVEVQALAVRTYYASPLRNTTGYDPRRLNMLLAVLEKYAGLKLRNYDIFVNVVGGLKVSDWSIDAAVLMAIVSAYRGFPLNPEAAFVGEVGLTGDLLPSPSMDLRAREARRVGIKTIYAHVRENSTMEGGIKILKATDIEELIGLCLE